MLKSNIPSKTKKRNWACVVYPESAPADWIEILKRTGPAVAISPLHDKDINPDEQEKKAHWHVLLVYSGPKSLASMKEFCASFGGTLPISIESVRGYYRYFTHKDNPEKYQYDESEIQTLGGFSILDFVEMTKSEMLAIQTRLVDVIEDQGFVEYHSLIQHVRHTGTAEELDVAMGKTIFFSAYLTSRRYKAQQETSQLTLKDRLTPP